MILGTVVFDFFELLALTMNFGFFLGDIDNPDHHNVYELFAALIVASIVVADEPLRAARVMGYPETNTRFLAYALEKQLVEVDTFERRWLDTQRYEMAAPAGAYSSSSSLRTA
jgi:hypothetical protein